MTEITQADLDEKLTAIYCVGYDDGAEKELAAIVAWLRANDEQFAGCNPANVGAYLADAIEAGEHLNGSILSPKPDPLVDAMNDSLDRLGAFEKDEADRLRAALAKRGGRIVFDD
jgi:hypothetical protein